MTTPPQEPAPTSTSGAPEADQAHDHRGAFAGMHSHDGGGAHWHDEFGTHNAEELTAEEFAARKLDWQMHNVQVVTVGVDIGSSTSHLMFSKISMQLVGEGRDVHSVVVGREILAQSPIILTPYLPDNTIDADAIEMLIYRAYLDNNATSEDVDTGAIILTGEALKRVNGRAIAERFSQDVGKFVCASAGHHLEAVLAANGSGTVSRSRRDRQTLLNVDIGGGTTKLALVRDGEVVATAAVAIGARLLVLDESRRLRRIDGPAQQIAASLGIELAMGERLSVYEEANIVEAWTGILAGLIERRPLSGIAAELMLTDPLPSEPTPTALVFSGGVSEFFFRRELRDFGDLGKPLADALRAAVGNGTIRLPVVMDASGGIRSTAVGASLFTTQVGFNLYISDEAMLPLTNVPVLVPRLELRHEVTASEVTEAIHDAITRLDIEDGEQPLALVFTWSGDLEAADTRALAEGARDGLPRTFERGVPLVFVADTRLGSFARMLKEDLGMPGGVLSFDGVTLHEFDFIDIAPLIQPTTVVPITIKSLLFAGGLDRRSVKQALYDAAMSQPRQDAAGR